MILFSTVIFGDNRTIIFLFCLFFYSVTTTLAQSLLEKKVFIKTSNERVDQVLRQIEEKGGFNFSYNPQQIEIDRRISAYAGAQTVRDHLNMLFSGTVTYKEKRKYIILHKAPAEINPTSFFLNGYVIDDRTGEKLAMASIFEPSTMTSTVSDQFGYYRIRLPVNRAKVKVEIRKENYYRETLEIDTKKEATYVSIHLVPSAIRALSAQPVRPVQDSSRLFKNIAVVEPDQILDTVSKIEKEESNLLKEIRHLREDLIRALSTAQQVIHAGNIPDTLYRKLQVSFVPFIGSNHQLSGNVINNYSYNIWAGYSLGIRRMEVGGFVNIVRWDVSGAQFAGIGNLVGRNFNGFQYANFTNLNTGNFNGAQMSWVLNVATGNFKGLQFSTGLNVVGKNLNGWQVGGVINYAGQVRGGHQVGWINIADSTKTTPIGLISFVKRNGYRRYEVSSDELNVLNFSFKTGVRKFYNIITLGTSLFVQDKASATFGYGVGSALSLGKGWMLNGDLTAHGVFGSSLFAEPLPVFLLRAGVSVEKKLKKNLAVTAGPGINWLYSDDSGILQLDKGVVSPFWLSTKPTETTSEYTWLGFRVGIRYCYGY